MVETDLEHSLYFSIEIQGVREIVVTEFEFNEGLSELFNGKLMLSSTNHYINPEKIIDNQATLKVYRNGHVIRHFNGIIKSFTKADTGHHYTVYHAEIVPTFYRLSLVTDSRIFQHKSVVDIVEELLNEHGVTQYALALRNSHEMREYCVQYRESSFAFIERILAEEGIFYYFEHGENGDQLILADSSSVVQDLEGEYEYNPNPGGFVNRASINHFSFRSELAPTKTVLKDYSFKSPSFHYINQAFGSDNEYLLNDYEHYDYPGRYKEQGVGSEFSKTRMNYLQRDIEVGSGKSSLAEMTSGFIFPLSDHTEDSLNRRWLLTRVHHKGIQSQAVEHTATEGMTTYNNIFYAIPGNREWKPTPETKPRVDGPQVAVITGPDDEEIYTDEFGRVKVQFPWDRYGEFNENSSAWLRVSQGWAGAAYGSVTIPRIGHEVIISFLEGDPDQPVISGRAYHATNRQPHRLPEHKTKTVMKTQTHQGEGFNEFTFEDESGEEEIYIHAQKDMNTLVKNDQVTHIENNYHMRIDKEAMTLVKENAHYTVEGERRTDILSNEHYKTDGSLHAKQKGKWLVETGDEIHFKSGSQMVLDAGDNITLKVGGNFVYISPAGVDIVGVVVNVNAGGSPGIGADLTQKAPLMPAQMSSLAGPAPFCEECEKCQGEDSSSNGSSEGAGASGSASSSAPPAVSNPSLAGDGLTDAFCGQDQVMDKLRDQMNGGSGLGDLSSILGAAGIDSMSDAIGNISGLMDQLNLGKYGFDNAITGSIEQIASLVGMAQNGVELEDLIGLPGGYLKGHGISDFDFTGGGIAGKPPVKGGNSYPDVATPPFVPPMR